MKTVKKRSQLQEKSVAKELGARVVVASGAMWNSKGDVRSEDYLIECKTTSKGFYSLKASVWEKIEEEAIRDGMRVPILAIDLQDHYRVFVFNPKDFELQTVGSDYKAEAKKSVRITLKELGFDYIQDSKKGIFHVFNFCICGHKTNMLCCMKADEFKKLISKED